MAAEASYGVVKGLVSYTESFQIGGSYGVEKGSVVGNNFNSTPVTLSRHTTLVVIAAVNGVKTSAANCIRNDIVSWWIRPNNCLPRNVGFVHTYQWVGTEKDAAGQKSSTIIYTQKPQ